MVDGSVVGGGFGGGDGGGGEGGGVKVVVQWFLSSSMNIVMAQ